MRAHKSSIGISALALVAALISACANPCSNRTNTRVYVNGVRGFTTEELPNNTVQFHPGGPQHGPQCVVVQCRVITPTGRTDGY